MSVLDKLAPEEQAVVRHEVKGLLDRSESFAALSPQEQQRVANGVVNTVAFLADPTSGIESDQAVTDAEALAARRALAKSLALEDGEGVTKLRKRLAGEQDLVGEDFDAGALRAGTGAFRDLVSAVDFPDFVSGLVEGVFTSIVDSSIRQMQAYSQLLEGVVQSVEQFAADNVTMNQARDYAANRFPSKLEVKITGGQPRIARKGDTEDEEMAEVKAALGLDPDVELDLDDEESEAELARQAQLEMARVRQQQLATMVLLGINRIVVTDGLINARVVFDVRSTDEAQRRSKASMHDSKREQRQFGHSGGWFSTSYDRTTQDHMAVVKSATDEESESRAEMKAKLSGEVKVNFNSETFPLEQMASSVQIGEIGNRAAKG